MCNCVVIGSDVADDVSFIMNLGLLFYALRGSLCASVHLLIVLKWLVHVIYWLPYLSSVISSVIFFNWTIVDRCICALCPFQKISRNSLKVSHSQSSIIGLLYILLLISVLFLCGYTHWKLYNIMTFTTHMSSLLVVTWYCLSHPSLLPGNHPTYMLHLLSSNNYFNTELQTNYKLIKAKFIITSCSCILHVHVIFVYIHIYTVLCAPCLYALIPVLIM